MLVDGCGGIRLSAAPGVPKPSNEPREPEADTPEPGAVQVSPSRERLEVEGLQEQVCIEAYELGSSPSQSLRFLYDCKNLSLQVLQERRTAGTARKLQGTWENDGFRIKH